MRRMVVGALVVGFGVLAWTGRAYGQTSLADYDYEHLSFRGFSFEGGYLWPNDVESTYMVGLRVDLGYLGPGLRLVPGVAYWSSEMKDEEIRRLEKNIDELAGLPTDPASDSTGVDLGTIDFSDFILSLDSHFVWSIPWDFLTYLGAGVSLHIQDGDGAAIDGTFVEDLLDTVKPGLNLHGGLEYPLSDSFRIYGMGRFELMGGGE